MVSLRVITPSAISSLAFPTHTFVPWERPDILKRSENVSGFVSISIFLTNFVPNSGTPKVPVGQFICSGLSPSASGDWKRDMVFLSSSGTS